MRIGSPAHKELLCRSFFEAHRKYEPEDLPWPALDAEALALLRGIPFWTHAVQAEADAGPMITAVAARERDPLLREALELQAAEETRHARLLGHMIALYELPCGEVHVDMPADVIEGFIDFGFEECLDSFGAFGLFKLAREHMLVPEPVFAIFDRVMQEEAHHITFFINWFAHRQANRGLVPRLLRPPKSGWHYAKAIRKIVNLVRSDDTPDGKDFVVTGAAAFVENLTPRLVVDACLSENERRLADVDRRLLVPRLIPDLARIARMVLGLVPARSTARIAANGHAAEPRADPIRDPRCTTPIPPAPTPGSDRPTFRKPARAIDEKTATRPRAACSTPWCRS